MLVNVTLRLLLNLSFDPKLRQEMVKLAMLPQLCDMMSKSACAAGQLKHSSTN